MRVLWIDDEADASFFDSVVDSLRRYGIEVQQVTSVTQLSEVLEQIGSADAILLDILMPPEQRYSLQETNEGTTTGLAVLKEIRSIDQNVPVVVLSVKRRTDMPKSLEALSIAEYLEKPTPTKHLAETLLKHRRG